MEGEGTKPVKATGKARVQPLITKGNSWICRSTVGEQEGMKRADSVSISSCFEAMNAVV